MAEILSLKPGAQRTPKRRPVDDILTELRDACDARGIAMATVMIEDGMTTLTTSLWAHTEGEDMAGAMEFAANYFDE